jgi:VIT1/CCC1 family predicted Fe2+/Mn2+ transporter
MKIHRKSRPPVGTGSGDPTQATPATLRRWRRRLADEEAEAATYRHLAGRREGEEREILLLLAEAEARHAAHWRTLLGTQVPARPRASARILTLSFLARRFGTIFVLAAAQRAENRSPNHRDVDATESMAADEVVHAEVVRALTARGRAQLSGTVRASVFGANDGLVSNLALVVGVAGGGAGATAVLTAGVIGVLAGGASMAAGEYVSVRSQEEMLQDAAGQQTLPSAMHRLDVDANELSLLLRARGQTQEEAERRSVELLSGSPPVVDESPGEPAGAELLGLNARSAAWSSFLAFSLGAAIPVLPFLLGADLKQSLILAVLLDAGALLATGAFVGVLTGGPPLRRGLRQLAIGGLATLLTFAAGLLFGQVSG